MNALYKTWKDLAEFVSLAFARIFSPNEKEVPKIGVQPFEGDPYNKTNTDW
jgi:hypothetical protein